MLLNRLPAVELTKVYSNNYKILSEFNWVNEYSINIIKNNFIFLHKYDKYYLI